MIERTQRRLAQFEQRYGVDTARFLQEMAAEDLEGGDLEYVEWAGEAKLLEGLEVEPRELERGHGDEANRSARTTGSVVVSRRHR